MSLVSFVAPLVLMSTYAAGHTPSCYSNSLATEWSQPVDPLLAQEVSEEDEARTGISVETREYFMRLALEGSIAYSNTSCPFAPFGVVVVNHTAGPNISDASIVCYGSNDSGGRGPLWHGEMAAVDNCTNVLKAKFGPTATRNASLWQQLSLYTTGESCPMCMSAQRWAKIGENIWSVGIDTLTELGWGQIQISSDYVQHQSDQCAFGNGQDSSYQTRLVSRVIEEEIAPYFAWQYNAKYPCPPGCARGGSTGGCIQM